MKSTICFVASLLVAVQGAGATEPATSKLPQKGTPYAEARALLLSHGLTIAPERPENPDSLFREMDCAPRQSCMAIFLEPPDAEGWRDHLVVEVDPATKTVLDVRSPITSDGLPRLPPPLPADVPQLKGSYLKARKVLIGLGFHPAHWRGGYRWNERCTDKNCKRYVTLPEITCSGTGISFCRAYWISKGGRALRITTILEYPEVYFVEWASEKALREDMQNR